jgi:hypothetical protein
MVTWEIHYARIDEHGKETDEGVFIKRYKRKGYAIRVARQIFGHLKGFHWWLVGRPDDDISPFKLYTE